MKETYALERTVSLVQWANATPGVRLELLNYAEVFVDVWVVSVWVYECMGVCI